VIDAGRATRQKPVSKVLMYRHLTAASGKSEVASVCVDWARLICEGQSRRFFSPIFDPGFSEQSYGFRPKTQRPPMPVEAARGYVKAARAGCWTSTSRE